RWRRQHATEIRAQFLLTFTFVIPRQAFGSRAGFVPCAGIRSTSKLRWNNFVRTVRHTKRTSHALTPLIHDHINLLGRYSFAIPEAVIRFELRPLHNPAADDA